MEPSGDCSPAQGATSDMDKEWCPTHVQVTVLRARSLRAKGSDRTSNPYCIMQLQDQKFQTSVIYRSLGPEWKEECTFRLPHGISPMADHIFKLTIMHRAHRGFDKFLGQIVLPIEHIFLDKSKRTNEWFSLLSKPGKREKARGQVQLSLVFMQVLEERRASSVNENLPKNSVLSMFRRRVSLGKTSLCKEGSALKPRKGVKFQQLLTADSKHVGSSIPAANPLKEVGAMMVQQALPMVHPVCLSQSDPGGSGLHQAPLMPKPRLLGASPLPACSLRGQPEHPGSMKHGTPFSSSKKHSKPLKEDRTQDMTSASGSKNHSLPPLPLTLPPTNTKERAETMKAHQVRYSQPSTGHLRVTAPPADPEPTFLQRVFTHIRTFIRTLACCVSGEEETKDPLAVSEQHV